MREVVIRLMLKFQTQLQDLCMFIWLTEVH